MGSLTNVSYPCRVISAALNRKTIILGPLSTGMALILSSIIQSKNKLTVPTSSISLYQTTNVRTSVFRGNIALFTADLNLRKAIIQKRLGMTIEFQNLE